MVSRKDACRTETGTRDTVIQDFRQRMEENRQEARRRQSALGGLKTACGVLSVLVLACGVTMFNNYHRMRQMESVIASALPEGMEKSWSELIGGENEKEAREPLFEDVPGEVYPTKGDIVIEPESMVSGESVAVAGGQARETAPGQGDGQSSENTQRDEQAASRISGGNQAAVPVSETNQDIGQAAGQTHGESQASDASQTVSQQSNQPANPARSDGAGHLSSAQEEAEAAALTPEPVVIPDNAMIHTVQDGETLYGICLEYYHSVNNLSQICQWNQLTDENHLSVGQRLYMPPAE